VRKQQVGTAHSLKRTQRTALHQTAAHVPSGLSSPARLIGTSVGKENASAAGNLGADAKLVLPVHAGQAKASAAKQLTGHDSRQHECSPG